MTLYAKIQEEREEAAINQLIETSRKYHATEADILNDIMTSYNLTEEVALDCIKEYDKQPA